MGVNINELCVVIYPDPVLRETAKEVTAVTDEVVQVGLRMLDLMHEAPGVGLAGPQVGLGWRVFVANPTGEASEDRVFINPVLRDASRELVDHEEGCLSLPEVNGSVRRPGTITIEALDIHGERFCLTSSDLAARVWQHECDHLDGVLIIDRMTPIDRMANERTIRGLEQGYRG